MMRVAMLAAIAAVIVTAYIRPADAHQTGIASFYDCCRQTASGERFNKQALTAAHRTLPFGTVVRVTNQHNGRSVTVRINDRGPVVRGRIIDLTPPGARAIGMDMDGVAPVTVEVVGR